MGYLLNALDDHEARHVERELQRDPHLRAELAMLQREIAPLDHLSDSVEPPPGLARRTCAHIWETLDKEEQLDAEEKDADEESRIPNSETFMNSAFFSPESMLPPSFLLQTPEPEESPRESVERRVSRSRRRREIEDEEDEPPRHSRIGLIASVSVGIVIACFLFPMIRYAERSTRYYVTDTWRTEINRRVGQYEQIYGSPGHFPSAAETVPYNLDAASNVWQEIRLEDITLSPKGFLPHLHPDCMFAAKRDSSLLFPPPIENKNESPLEVPSDHILLLTRKLESSGHLTGQESPVRVASGKTLIFPDERILSLVLPDAE